MGKKLSVAERILRRRRMWEKKHPEEVKKFRANLKRQNTIARKRLEKAGGIEQLYKKSVFNKLSKQDLDLIFRED